MAVDMDDFDSLRDKLLGLGNRSFRKSYYPELQKRIEELEKTQKELRKYKEHLEELVQERTDELRMANEQLQEEIFERRRAEEALMKNRDRLEKINNGLLQLGPDHNSNLNRLTALCGELLGADCALYNRMQGELLCSIGRWQTPPDFKAEDNPAGHICYDLINDNKDEAVLIGDLPGTSYAQSDPNVAAYGLQTYFGQAVKCQGQPIGSLCVVYQTDFRPSEEDRRILGIMASAIGNEDKRKQSEEELKESQQRFIDIINFLPDATLVIDTEGKVIAWNRAVEEMTGISAAAILGKGGYEYALPFHGERIPILIDLVLNPSREVEAEHSNLERKGGMLAAQILLPSLKGRATYIFATASALYDSRGNIVGAIESIRDITRQKQAEQALIESQQQLADIIDFLPDATFVIDREGKIIAWNRAMQEMVGIGAAEMLGKSDYEYALPIYGVRRPILIDFVLEQREEIEAKYLTLERHGGVLAAKSFIADLRGREAYLFGTASALYDSRGNIAGAIESIRDFTSQKLMEEAVRRAEEKYRDIVENSVTGIYQASIEGRFLSLNASLAYMLGYDSPEELKGISDVRQLYVHPERRSEMLRQIEEHGEAREFEAEFFRKDKSIVWISHNLRAVRNSTGKIVYLEGTASDITDAKFLRARLDQAQKMEAIGTLAGGIAHDFNNILTPIIGYTELSLNMVPDDSRLSHNMKHILLSANRARDLVRQILTFSRKTEQERKPVQISLIVKEVLKLLRSSLPSTIDIRLRMHPDAVHSTTMADPTHIHQVLMNLCTNAAHAMRAQGGKLTVTLENVEIGPGAGRGATDMGPGAYLRLSVADTGHGMDDALKQRIFDPYFTTKGPNEGTGLGLAVVYGIVKNLSGAIAVSSKPGGGTTVDVYFPRTKTAWSTSADPPVLLPTGHGRVLVVDDEKFIVDMVREMLETLGYEAVPRNSSTDALEAFRARPESFDLVITDMTMPHMTGINLAREILMIRPRTPIILCTGFSETLDENKVKSLGINELLMKPVSMRDMAAAVNRIMAKG
jgi:PAS domain S-box-containing protein